MSRYIDTDMLDQVVSDLNSHHNAGITRAEYKRISGVLWAFPAADVRVIKRGQWNDRGSLSCRCSECGCKSPKEYNYRPNCGASMMGDNAIQHTERVENALGALDEVEE